MSGLQLSPLDSVRYKDMPHVSNPHGISLLDMGHVQKCPTDLGIDASRNTTQVMGGNYRRTADKTVSRESIHSEPERFAIPFSHAVARIGT